MRKVLSHVCKTNTTSIQVLNLALKYQIKAQKRKEKKVEHKLSNCLFGN